MVEKGEKSNTTSKGMPRVSKETVGTVVDSIEKGSVDWGQKLEQTKKRMAEEQPHLVVFIESQVGKFPEELHNSMFEMVVGTYALLEQQAGANRLKGTFGSGLEEKA